MKLTKTPEAKSFSTFVVTFIHSTNSKTDIFYKIQKGSHAIENHISRKASFWTKTSLSKKRRPRASSRLQ